MSAEEKITADGAGAAPSEAAVLDALRQVLDPELNSNIVDLGLVYGVSIGAAGEVRVRMTLTSPGCPYGPTLALLARQALLPLRGCSGAEVEWVWDPPWSPARMTEELRLELGFDV